MPPVTAHAHLGRVVLVRHGESVANAAGMFTGVLDVPLSERGVLEAHRAAELVAATGIRFDLALTSELERAWATADILAADLPALPAVERTWLLNERTYGALTGRTKADVCAEVGEAQFLAWGWRLPFLLSAVIVVQFGLATIPWWSSAASSFTPATTSGTSSCIRQ